VKVISLSYSVPVSLLGLIKTYPYLDEEIAAILLESRRFLHIRLEGCYSTKGLMPAGESEPKYYPLFDEDVRRILGEPDMLSKSIEVKAVLSMSIEVVAGVLSRRALEKEIPDMPRHSVRAKAISECEPLQLAKPIMVGFDDLFLAVPDYIDIERVILKHYLAVRAKIEKAAQSLHETGDPMLQMALVYAAQRIESRMARCWRGRLHLSDIPTAGHAKVTKHSLAIEVAEGFMGDFGSVATIKRKINKSADLTKVLYDLITKSAANESRAKSEFYEEFKDHF
jgi:hypothetical protein